MFAIDKINALFEGENDDDIIVMPVVCFEPNPEGPIGYVIQEGSINLVRVDKVGKKFTSYEKQSDSPEMDFMNLIESVESPPISFGE